jgi:gliding motility-associated-like protein
MLSWGITSAQLIVVQGAAMELAPEQLVRDHLVGKGVTVSNVTQNGSSGVINRNHIGYFHAAGGASDQLQMESGIIMTTGKAVNAVGPNNASAIGFRTNTGSDPDLDALNDRPVFDACILEFDFVPQCDTISFSYAFGSEEFYKFCNKDINDVFGFFLSGPGIEGPYTNNGINIALMPNNISLVTINNLCLDSSVLWNNRDGSFFQYNALTHLLTAWHVVIPFQTYHIKLAIGDDVDAWYDSGVFLEMGSFSAGFDFSVRNIPSNSKAGWNAVEGCNNVTVSFRLPHPALSEIMIDFTVAGSAVKGVDYAEIPGSVTFHPGEDSAAIIILPFTDTLVEADETVLLKIIKNSCSGISLINDTIFIKDNSPMSVRAGNDLCVCPGDTTRLAARVTGGFGPYLWLWDHSLGNDSVLIVVPSAGINVYTVFVADRCGVELDDTVVVSVDTIALLTNNPPGKEICNGSATGVILTSNISSAFFRWEPVLVSDNVSGYTEGAGETIDQVLNIDDSSPGSVIYHIRVTGDGCDTSSTDYRVNVNPLPEVEIKDPGFLIAGYAIDLHTIGGFSEYLWSTGQADSVISVSESGLYWVRVKNEYSCFGSDTIILNEFGLYIPNAFTPDGDGLNDRFRIVGSDPDIDADLQVFDRWGGLVFETSDLSRGWDGLCGNQPCQAGTYIWIIRVKSYTTKVYKGTILLMR